MMKRQTELRLPGARGRCALPCALLAVALGLPQAAIVWLLRPVGVPDAHSLALPTLLTVIGITRNLPGALLYAVRRKPVT